MIDTDNLEAKLLRIKEIGREITLLTEESKLLRGQVAVKITECSLGEVTEESPTKFIWHGTVVSVIKAKGIKDFTVTFEELATLF